MPIQYSLNRLGTPILLGYLLKYFTDPKNGEEKTTFEDALLFAGGISLATGINALTINQAIFGAFHLGGRIRVAVCSLVYRKVSYYTKIYHVNLWYF